MNDVLERILELRTERNWSVYRLAKESHVPISTISSWYKKNIVPSVPSLQKICDGFGISMSNFFMTDGDYYIATGKEKEFLVELSRFDPDMQERFYLLLKGSKS